MTRRIYSDEFKREAVELTKQPGMTKAQIARDLGISANSLATWCKALAEHGEKAFPGRGHARDEEVTALKRELARVKQERDFLREAATFFAKGSK